MARACGSCGLVVRDDVRFCERCGYQFADDPKANIGVNRTNGKQNASPMIIVGYLCGFVALFLFPPAFGVAGLVIGIVNLAKGRLGHGVAQIVISITCGILGIFIGIYMGVRSALNP